MVGAVKMRARRYLEGFNEVCRHLDIVDMGTHLIYSRPRHSSRTATGRCDRCRQEKKAVREMISFPLILNIRALTRVCLISYFDVMDDFREEKTRIYALLGFTGRERWWSRREDGGDVLAHSGQQRQ